MRWVWGLCPAWAHPSCRGLFVQVAVVPRISPWREVTADGSAGPPRFLHVPDREAEPRRAEGPPVAHTPV